MCEGSCDIARNYIIANCGQDIYKLFMHGKSIWFDSPLHKLAFSHPHREAEQEPEDSHFDKHQPYSPEVLPPQKFHAPSQPLSPWSSLLHPDNEQRGGHLSLPGLFAGRQHELIEERVIFSEEEEEMMTPQRDAQRSGMSDEDADIHTTGKKSQFQASRGSKKPRPRDKGLRKLSEKAFQIVREMHDATYKQVAKRLLEELTEQQLQGENKEVQNIKRRVYDALNVLIALGVLRKDGRRIISEKDFRSVSLKQAGSEEIEKLKQKITAKEAVLAMKQKQLRQVEEKYLCFSSLLHRNRETKQDKDTAISFPFVGIIVEKGGKECTPYCTRSQVVVRTLNPVQPFGDIDSLKWLRQLNFSIDGYFAEPSSFS